MVHTTVTTKDMKPMDMPRRFKILTCMLMEHMLAMGTINSCRSLLLLVPIYIAKSGALFFVVAVSSLLR
ncbi:hypothetical protein Syun_019226 [Stephania yunnanensis]|uniref:Uncharacterized protein n=1 Tax=Stephania yunnanensis TaxID=152371 RepID=A0AAP0ITU8_9MAGN